MLIFDANAELRERFLPFIAKHTGVLLYRRKTAKGPADFGLGACVHIEYQGHRFSVTCEHVTENADELYNLVITPSQEPRPLVISELSPATVIKSVPQIDLAILDSQNEDFAAALKQPYPLANSDYVTQECLEHEPGALSVIAAAFASHARIVPHGKVIYFEGPVYAAGGPIISVSSVSIIADFREKQRLYHNVELFPQLEDMQISGASRDLSGMSGSGLWIRNDHGVVLAGILKGTASGRVGDPELRFMPVWLLPALLNDLLKESVPQIRPLG
jgi:hypothetical protein